jgi:hypothetical protein
MRGALNHISDRSFVHHSTLVACTKGGLDFGVGSESMLRFWGGERTPDFIFILPLAPSR